MLGLVDHQEDLELLGQGGRWRRLLHERRGRGGRLLDGVGDGAEGAEEAGGAARGGGGGGLGWLGLLGVLAGAPLLGCGGAGRRFGRRLGRGSDLLGRRGDGGGGSGGGNRGGRVRPLEVRHVAVRQVGHEAAVGEAAAEEVHGCG